MTVVIQAGKILTIEMKCEAVMLVLSSIYFNKMRTNAFLFVLDDATISTVRRNDFLMSRNDHQTTVQVFYHQMDICQLIEADSSPKRVTHKLTCL